MKIGAISPGHPLPLGATLTADGVQFCVFSRNADQITLLLFEDTVAETPSIELQLDPALHKTGDIWHIHIEGLKKEQLYLYRADGPWDPANGHRFDSACWLIDPYAKALTMDTPWNFMDKHTMPRCVVVDDEFDWQGDRRLNYPLQYSVIYETHVRGLSMSPSAKSEHKGSYKGIIDKIPYFQDLGITSLEFLPVHEFNPHELIRKHPRTGEHLVNYWGYSPTCYFSPSAWYASSGSRGEQVVEFKEMVRELHKAGIEVILDVVFNHTGEGNEDGPTFSFRGFDNSIYYILEEDKARFANYSGCGNTMNCNHPIMRSLIMDCLHYWVIEMHVDGFRFDLGSILGRDQNGELLANPPVLETIAEDPILRDTKIIAEAWDAAGAYQVGGFPGGRWAEWNDRFRDDIRKFWNGSNTTVSNLAMRLSGSSDLYMHTGRKPFHSINFITSHDGFTLKDLVSYSQKHNLDNGEENRDGSDHNCSSGYGTEGETENTRILSLRNKLARNLFTTLILSTGTPMILGGDEFGRTQKGNNNAYCQDNEISWYDWTLVQKNAHFHRFCRELIRFRRRHPAFYRPEFFVGQDINLNGLPDITWTTPDGQPVDWSSHTHTLSVRIDGSKSEIIANTDDDDFLLLFNAATKSVAFKLSPPPEGKRWYLKLHTGRSGRDAIYGQGKAEPLSDHGNYEVPARSIVLLISSPDY
ncbi:MAG: glycogen debranching protein GlgX [Spirochaetales bacterium]|nr:glycogen debranching protein GlgX [Spirochaetales bacterium]